MKSSGTDTGQLGPLEYALCGVLLVMVTVTFAQVLFRYLFQAPLAWSEEAARFLLMWLAALSAAYGFKNGSHFALRFLVDRLPDTAKSWSARLVTGVVVGFLATFAWQALRFTWEVRTMVAPATGISMAIPYSSALVGAVLMLYFVLRQALADAPAESAGPGD